MTQPPSPDAPISSADPNAPANPNAPTDPNAPRSANASASVDPRRLRELFDQLVDLPPQEADRQLASDLADQPAMQQALQRLLARDRQAADSGPLPPLLPDAGARSSPPPEDPAPSTDPVRLGRFHVVRRLGAGGMGVVYDAYDDVLDRRVALKLLSGSTREHALLLREARALARLAHPNVVPIYEVGEQQGRPFIAMERVEGQPLSDWLQRTDVPLEDTLRLLLQAGWALSAAHDSGVIHRDFKPQNVLVGHDGRVRVVDFGVAALRERPLPAPADVPNGDGTGDGTGDGDADSKTGRRTVEQNAASLLAGTPAFMAPEQLGAGEVTPRSDQFSFGVVLYRAVYRQAPFAGDDLTTLLASVKSAAVRPPPRRPDLPDWLWPIIRRALSVDPSDRYASMTDLLRAIEEHLPKDPGDAPGLTRKGRTRILTAFLGCTLILASVAHRVGPRHMMGTPLRVVGIALGLLLVALLLVGVFFRSLSATPHGRRSVAFLLLVPAVLLGHRLLGWQLGTPVPSILAMDFFLLSSLFACGAVLFDRWLGIPALVFLIAMGLTAYNGLLGALLFPIVGPGSVALILWRTLRR